MRRTVALIALTALPLAAAACGSETNTDPPSSPGTMPGTTVDRCPDATDPGGAVVTQGTTGTSMASEMPSGTAMPPAPNASPAGSVPPATTNPCVDPNEQAPVTVPGTASGNQTGQTDGTRIGDTGSGGSSSGPSSGGGGESPESTSGSEQDRPAGGVGRAPTP